MSVNALIAHENGERPWSEWRKGDFDGVFVGNLQSFLKKLTLKELKTYLLRRSSCHHTGKYFNKTEFFEISADAVEEFTAEKIQRIIDDRPKREKKQREDPLFVTAKITFTEWVGRFRNYQKPVKRVEVVQYMSDAKLITLEDGSKKRLSSVVVLDKIVQKTRFADKKRLKK